MIKWFTSKYIYIFIYIYTCIYIYIYTGIHTHIYIYIYNCTWYMWMYTCVSRKLTHFASDWSRYIFYFYIPLQTVCPPCLIPLIPIKSFLCTPIISYLPPLKNYEISPILLVQFPHVSYFLRVSSIWIQPSWCHGGDAGLGTEWAPGPWGTPGVATRTGARSEGFGDAMLRAMVTLLAAVFFPWT